MSIFCSLTMSRVVITGNFSAYGQPVAGSIEEGPVVPRHPPRTFEHSTKYLSVSNAFPGPIMLSHHPGLPVSWLTPAACASPENACKTIIAFDFASFSSPYVSYATSTGVSVAPLSSGIESNRTVCVSTIMGGLNHHNKALLSAIHQ